MSVILGVRMPRANTPFFLEIWKMVEWRVYMSAPTSYPPIDIFPFLKWLPERFASWKTACRELYQLQRGLLERMVQPVKDRLARDEGNGCFMETLYQRAKEWDLDEEALL
jgi:hypothetical protein